MQTSAFTQASHATYRDPQAALAGSKSLASMLPTILTTGVITLVVTGVLRLLWAGMSNDFFSAWMEAWFTTWPIAFPIAYLSKPVIRKISQSLTSRPLAENTSLSLVNIESASDDATKSNRLKVQRSSYLHKYY
ncbi:DUF2798 domain-containing protein [Undibacterium sp. Ren11W]|uniref:DUF2798 domain-containing protein n=1 Tax=Undibacterium sp. Ren11W TaxID=3413045 RepID=UPI003BF2EB48